VSGLRKYRYVKKMARESTLLSSSQTVDLDELTRGTLGKRVAAPVIEAVQQEKDVTELELEKLVFGDDHGFRQQLQAYEDPESSNDELMQLDGEEVEDGEADSDLDAVKDNDLFFFDAGAAGSALRDVATVPISEDQQETPAWVDSDDERLTISLASHTRLRKLRHHEGEDMIDGKEYSRRLRQQYERLHPVPDWAQPMQHRRKRRRLSRSSDMSGSDADADMSDASYSSDVENSISAQPLASLLQSTALLSQPQSASERAHRSLRPGTIDIQRLRDIGTTQHSAIHALAFHPTLTSPPLLLSSGPAGLISLHHITPSSSSDSTHPLLTTLALQKLPLSSAAFHLPPSASANSGDMVDPHSGSTRIFFAGRRRYYHIWDMPTGKVSRISRVAGHASEQRTCERFKLSPCGRYMALVGSARKGGGVVNILDASTSLWLAQCRVEGRNGVADIAWWGDGAGLVVIGKGGEVVEYSVVEKRVVARWRDEGAVGSTVIALGGEAREHGMRRKGMGGDRWVAVGSQSGIVNVYDRMLWIDSSKVPEQPRPRRVLDQLVTPTSCLEFSPDGQLLVVSSRWKRDALRLVHLPSCTVYKNWPTSGTPFGRVTAVSWTPDSRYLAVGNEAGKIRLWEVRS